VVQNSSISWCCLFVKISDSSLSPWVRLREEEARRLFFLSLTVYEAMTEGFSVVLSAVRRGGVGEEGRGEPEKNAEVRWVECIFQRHTKSCGVSGKSDSLIDLRKERKN